MFHIAKVAVDKAAPHFDKVYDYLIPEGLPVFPGCRVTVPFGVHNHRRQGIVLALEEAEEAKGIKSIVTLVDPEPILGTEQLMLLDYLKHHTFCGYFEALKVLIPAGIGIVVGESYSLNREAQEPLELGDTERQILRYLENRRKPTPGKTIVQALGLSENHPALRGLVQKGLVVSDVGDRRKIQDERVAMVRLSPPFDQLAERERPASPQKLTKKQEQVVRLLWEVQSASIKEICYFCGLTRAVVDRLEQAGVVQIYEQQVYRNPYGEEKAPPSEEFSLSEEQQTAYDALWAQYSGQGAKGVVLLHGVTGSGKTQVFLKLAREVAKRGEKTLVLVPEISLTPQTTEKFRGVFGRRTAVLHSSLTLSQRMDEWQRIRRGEADIVVGTRSAVFAPLENLGLIVMDEEQEHSYQSEASPRYHAREVALLRGRYHNALLLLSSATPSVESYYLAKAGKYRLVELTQRYAGSALPEVTLIDMNEELAQSATCALSRRLTEELYHNLQAGEQSILLLNRRGYSTLIKCSSCGEVLTCPNCSVSLTYHCANGRLLCHYCGYSQEVPRECEHCHSTMVRYTGVGTQRLEEQLHTLFPEARVLRMDMDTTMSRFAYEKNFSAFAAGEYDIMVGTQMVAKGLNFPKVTLVGVLSADMSLYSDDFRSFEKTFSLLTQVVGRSGRAQLPGRAFIQTTFPENPIFSLASSQNYQDFYREEIQFRQLNLYPPFCNLVTVGFTGVCEEKVGQGAARFAQAFTQLAREEYPSLPLRVLEPGVAGVSKVAGKYRYQLILKCRVSPPLRELLERVRMGFYSDRRNREITAFIDMYG